MLRERLAYRLRELGLDVAPTEVTITGREADYVLEEYRFTLDERGVTLWLSCTRCGAEVEAGAVVNRPALGGLLAEAEGILAWGHSCPLQS